MASPDSRRRSSHVDPRPGAGNGRSKAGTALPGIGPEAERVRLALADNEQVARLSRTFRALGDPTRSRLVYALSMGELCVGDLAAALGTSMSAVSHQLRILRDLEIVRGRRVGRSQLYALNEEAFGFCSPKTCHAWKQTYSTPADPNRD